MKSIEAATILRRKEGSKERKNERNKKQTTESVPMIKHDLA